MGGGGLSRLLSHCGSDVLFFDELDEVVELRLEVKRNINIDNTQNTQNVYLSR